MFKTIVTIILACMPLFALETNRADSHAPIGVMGDHNHHQGEAMISYRYMNMKMDSLFNGSNEISLETAEAQYMMNPLDMNMQMHMLGGMWGFTNNMTLMAMIGYRDNSMTMINRMNDQTSTMESSGLSDLKLGTLMTLHEQNQTKLIANIGLSIPIGSINEKNADGVHLPYGMQLGSGTYDLLIGTTGVILFNTASIGAQVSSIIRLGETNYNYRLGNQYQFTGWAQKIWTNEFSTSLRGTLKIKENISGQDNRLSTMQINMSPMYDTDQGSIVSTIGIGFNYMPAAFSKTRVAGEYSLPIFRHSNSITLLNDSTLTIGIQQALY